MKGFLQILMSAIFLLLAAQTQAQSIRLSRYIMFTDTITDDGVTFAASSDDAEQENNEIDNLFDDDIDAGWEGEPDDLNILTAGLRFRDITIPKGATIDSAYIIVHSHEAKTAEDVARITIVGEASDDAQTFTEDMLIDERPQTGSSLLWVVDEPWGLWTPHRTPDIGFIIQEIIDRDGWQSGNSLAFLLLGEDQGPSEVENAREFESFENISDPEDGGDGQNYPDRIPELVIFYTAEEATAGFIEMPIMFTDTITDDGVTFAGSSDDAEQENNEIDNLFDDDIDVGWEGEPDDLNILTAGLRFRNLMIPKGATIDSVFIEVTSHESKTAEDVARITIVCEATDDAQTFTEDMLIDARPQTDASFLWEVAEPWGLWTKHRTPNLKEIVQEVVDRDGWQPGNAIAFILLGEDQGPSEVENAREFESYENISDPEDGGDGQNYPDRVPRLFIYFSGGEPIFAEDDDYPFYPIAVTETNDENGIADSLDVRMTLQGVVHSVNYSTNGIAFAIIDEAGDGTYVFSGDNPFNYNVTLGDEVRVKGSIQQFRGLTELVPDSLFVVSTGNDLVEPVVVDSLGEYTESQLIRMNNLTLVNPTEWTNEGSGFNVMATNGSSTIVLRIDSDTDLFGTEAPNFTFDVIGIGGQFDTEEPLTEGYQLLPRILMQDIINPVVDEALATTIQVYPNPANSVFYVETTVAFDQVKLTNNIGQEVLSLNNVSGLQRIDVSSMAKGIYNLTFTKGASYWTERLIVK